MSFIDLMSNTVWTETDITNRTRAMVAGEVSEDRQNDLRTIMLGHISGMRKATDSEMAEIIKVKTLTEAAAVEGAAARADMALLQLVLDYEALSSQNTQDIAAALAHNEEFPADQVDVPEAIANSLPPEAQAIWVLRHGDAQA